MSELHVIVAEIKAHSQSLARAPRNAREDKSNYARPRTESDGGWHQQEWRMAYESMFLRDKPQCRSTTEQDDLLFFVRADHKEGDEGEDGSFFVRRWSSELPEDIADPEAGPDAAPNPIADIDWRQSVYLNLVLQTTFTLTVAICSRQAIEAKKQGAAISWSPLAKVSKPVFASPTRISVDSKEEFSKPSYPLIYFAVEDYESAFESMVLTDPDHCLCVLLSARGGPALGGERRGSEAERQSSVAASLESEAGHARVLLFSGFVGFQQLQEAYHTSHRRFLGLLPGKSGHAKVMMKGPGGNGVSEVAVTDADVRQDEDSEAGEGDASHSNGLTFGGLYKASLGAVKQVGGALVGRPPTPKGGNRLQCSLMSVSLPWWCVTHDILFRPSS
ncbi:hypothetical protein CYMTET_42636 [Cymbomonas tetramitiformis]|uniref:Uncharacterized protein n=1 Tax=Cymbomonas tetramitiformis TaxID=36881 RepID=A0AAE0C5G4_9CHLO|nr:hypothetical protein CYMTET_42636 [Cymbomonas tetramitiformis]